MKIRTFPLVTMFAAVAGFAASSAQAATSTFTGAIDGDYLTGGNWSPSGVPNTSGGDTALINGGTVTYNPSGDLGIGNGGMLEIRSGSWTQINGIAWIQLGAGSGNGHILVSGGTFNQGTSTNINLSGSGNTFTVTGGAATFTTGVTANSRVTYNIAGGATTMNAGPLVLDNGGSFYVSAGSLLIGGNLVLSNGSTWQQSGGTVSVNGEFQYSSLSGGLMSGGIMNVATLMTGVNGDPGSTFNFSGGVINNSATSFSGWYGADNATHPFNFTIGSTGVINFLANTSVQDVESWLTAGGIQYNNTINPGAFSVTQNGGTVSLALAIPEPSTVLLVTASLSVVMITRRRAV